MRTVHVAVCLGFADDLAIIAKGQGLEPTGAEVEPDNDCGH